MKILIVSDTHGYNERMWEAVKKEEPFDMMIHCGDLECDPNLIRDRIDCQLLMVAGNNDYELLLLPRMRTFEIGKYKALLTHGHRYHLYGGYDSLYYLGVENKADFVFFGHTHIPVVEEMGPVTLVNPGSLTYPRQYDRKYSYIIMTVSERQKPEFVIKFL